MIEEKRRDVKAPAECIKEGSELLQLAYEERGIETRNSTDTGMPAAAVDFLTQSHRIND